MRALTILFCLLSLCCCGVFAGEEEGAKSAPEYSTKMERRGVVDYLVVYRAGKEIYAVGSGYGGFSEPSWSGDQSYFAVVDHSIKRGADLLVYAVDGDDVAELTVPDFQLSILGQYGSVDRSEYEGYSNIQWQEDEGELSLNFRTYGSLVDDIGGSWIEDSTFYHFQVFLSIRDHQSALLKVKNLKKEKPVIPEDASFTTAVYIRANIKDVWSALVDPKVRERADMLSLSKIELKKGGEINYAKGEITGKILELKPQELLTFSYEVIDYVNEKPSRISYLLQDLGKGVTLLHVTHDDFKKGSIIDGDTEVMWPITLSKIKTYLETGKPLYP